MSGAPGRGRRFRLAEAIDVLLTVSSLGVVTGLLHGIVWLSEDDSVFPKKNFIEFLSVACPFVQMLQLVTPMPLAQEAVSTLKVDGLPMPSIQSQAICNVLGACYGIQAVNSAVLVTNMFGLGCQIIYLTCYHFVVAANSSWLRFVVPLWLGLNVSFHVCVMILPINVLGHLIILFNIVLSGVPLMKLGSILRTRSSVTLPTGMTVVSCMNNALWTMFSLHLNDTVLLVPSLLGFVLSFFQILVILWCNHVLPFDLGFLLLLGRAPPAAKIDVLPTGKVANDFL